MTIVIRVPHHRRHRRSHYVSPATLGAKFAFIGTESVTKSVALTPGSNTISLSLEPGTYTTSVTTYDAAPAGGSIPSSAKPLSSASNLPMTVTLGEANLFSFTLDGVIASLHVTLPSATIGTAFASQPVSVVAKDAGGYTIVGTYENAILLTDTDEAGHTSVATSGSDHPAAGELLSSSDAATLSYDGSNANFTAAIAATAAGAARANATFVPTPVLTSLSATTGLDGTSVSETLTGDFATGATSIVVPEGSGITVLDASAAGPTQMTAKFFIDPHVAVAGGVLVTVQTGAGATSSSQTFTISTTGVDVVTKDTDTIENSQPGICQDGLSGELRNAICTANAGDTIVFDTTAMCGANAVTGSCTITLSAALPPIQQSQTIDGALFSLGSPRVIIDGASGASHAYRPFWAEAGTITLQNLQIQNVLAKGGAGGDGSSGGGGGAGLGAAVFVNSATVNVTNDYFSNCAVAGGKGGGLVVSSSSGGGGGGMGGNGGSMPRYPQETNPQDLLGAGGGGVLGNGANGADYQGGNGGYGSGGGGGQVVNGQAAGSPAGKGGTVYPNPSNSPSVTPSAGPGGAGKFGGGGGGGGSDFSGDPGAGGAGGFGGGGGAAGGGTVDTGGIGSAGGTGGPGGGGGGSAGRAASNGGALATISGGNGGGAPAAVEAYGGGGAAAGPAIFVKSGTLTTTNSTSNSCASATAGAAGGSGASAGGTDTNPVFNYNGTVNGDTNKGGYSNALPVVASPAIGKRRSRFSRKPHRALVHVT